MENAPLEPLTHLADGIGINNVSLFIGDQIAASDDNLLRQHKIINVLNCAVNCDINYVDETLDLTPGKVNRVFGYAPVRTAKIGMINGDGNDPILMFAAVHMLHGMLHQTFPEMYVVKPIFDKNSSFANRPQKYAPVIFGANFSQQAKSQAENCQR